MGEIPEGASLGEACPAPSSGEAFQAASRVPWVEAFQGASPEEDPPFLVEGLPFPGAVPPFLAGALPLVDHLGAVPEVGCRRGGLHLLLVPFEVSWLEEWVHQLLSLGLADLRVPVSWLMQEFPSQLPAPLRVRPSQQLAPPSASSPSAAVVLPLLGRQGSFLAAAPDQAAASPPSPASWSP